MKKILVSFSDIEKSVVSDSYEILKAYTADGHDAFLVIHNNGTPLVYLDLSTAVEDIFKCF